MPKRFTVLALGALGQRRTTGAVHMVGAGDNSWPSTSASDDFSIRHAGLCAMLGNKKPGDCGFLDGMRVNEHDGVRAL